MACLKTDRDGDEDTNSDDMHLFPACKMGSGVEPDRSCLK
jgi:hypothetical protein